MDHHESSQDFSELSFDINECDQSINYDESMSISEINQNDPSSEGDQSFNENDIFEDILEEPESQVFQDYPNEAYGDLMTLVIKNKLNNKTGNAIIKFFNKHANLVSSPLPTSIE